MSASIHQSQPPGQFYCPSCERTYHTGEHCPEDGTRLVRLKAAVDPLLGRNLDNRYTIVEKLGQGGMGAVYRGTQHSVGREIAIKVINAHLVSEPDAIRRFLREAKIASKLSHPNAVQVLEFGQTDDGLFYLVMELVSGRTLDQVLKAERVIRPERLVRIGVQVCDALEGAHALQIVHRDLKPANIMLLTTGRDHVKVLDFGLAKSVAPDSAATTMTNAGALLGTPAFMPPELALGQPCDGRADLYALGVILYLMGSGRLPFESESPHELIAMHGGDDPAPPMTGVPPALAAVIDRLLMKKPSERFQTAAEAREALEAALAGRMPTPVPFAGADTNPSLGPFPATPSQFAHLADTPVPPPRRRSSTALERIASSDTIAATPVPASAPSSMPSSMPASAPRRSWLIPVLALVAALGIGGGIYAATRGSADKATPAEQAVEKPAVETPAVKPADTTAATPAETPAVKPAETSAVKPAETPAPAVAPVTPPVTPPEATVEKPAETPTPTVAKPTTKPKPVKPKPTKPVVETKPVPTKPVDKPVTKPGLPF